VRRGHTLPEVPVKFHLVTIAFRSSLFASCAATHDVRQLAENDAAVPMAPAGEMCGIDRAAAVRYWGSDRTEWFPKGDA